MKVTMLGILLSVISLQAVAKIDEPDIHRDCQQADSYATLGAKAYQQGDYARARDIFRDQVAWSEFCHFPKNAIITAYNNIALSYFHQNEFRKAKAWLQLAPDDKKSQFNLAQVAEKLAGQTTALTPTGEYWQYAGMGSWNIVSVTKLSQGYHIEFNGVYMGQMALYYGPNTGEFSTDSDIDAQQAVYHQTEEQGGQCDVTLHFHSESVSLTTHGNCGFGHNVRAAGEFWRVLP
jgi:tetratricopeptide (TPR) repeat protein